jgi:Domain of unknown function (DUF4405)
MKRTHLNALMDALSFIAFLLLLSTGLLLEYQLPPGSGGTHGFGMGRGAGGRTITLLWGWTRHDWGQIHYWIALALVAILALHLLLHWKWIVCTVRGQHSDASGLRLALGAVGLVFTILLVSAPLFSTTTSATRDQLQESKGAAAVEK